MKRAPNRKIWIVISSAVLVAYGAALLHHAAALEAASRIDFVSMLFCLGGNLLCLFAQAGLIGALLTGFRQRTGLAERAGLAAGSLLAGHLPFQLGTVFKAHYAKDRFGIAYADYLLVQLGIWLASLGLAAAAGWLALGGSGPIAVGYGLLALATPVAGLGLWLLPKWPSLSSVRTTLRRFARPRLLLWMSVLVLLNFTGLALRFYGAGHSTEPSRRLVASLTMPAAAVATSVISLTPSSLGVRELAEESLTRSQSLPPGLGLAVTTVDRFFQVLCAVILWGLASLLRRSRDRHE